MSVGEYEREGIGAAPDAETVLAFEIALRLHDERWRIRPRLVTVAAPAAGAEWSVDVPGGCTWFVQTIRATYVASNGASTRLPQLIVRNGETTYFTMQAAAGLVASATVHLGWMSRVGVAPNIGGNSERVTAWPPAPLHSGLTIASVTSGIDVADQWSLIALYVIEVRERQLQERADAFRAIARGAHVDNYPGLLLGL